ncbi:MAG: transcriptional repressor [Tannerellaceae bacterium]|jgi:Fur family ferric uptake transcriptional regulator|nr:transcriptional repressor [Tannerellaceae bacterium]
MTDKPTAPEKIENKIYSEARKSFTEYLAGKKLRKTEERFRILEEICTFPGHFDICTLHRQLDEKNYHVSTATLYNTLEVLVDGRLIIRLQAGGNAVQYELRKLAETHLHVICTKCETIREVKNAHFRSQWRGIKTPRFTPEFAALYIYGLCSKCKNKMQKNGLDKKNNKKKK